jgi:hypothetical protein
MNRVVSFVTPLRSLRTLLSLPRRPVSKKGARVEMSVRDWARRDRDLFRSLQEIDLMRLRAFEQLFRRQGFTAKEAKSRAYVAYTIMMGDSILKDTIRDEVETETFLATAMSLLIAPPGSLERLPAPAAEDDDHSKKARALQ